MQPGSGGVGLGGCNLNEPHPFGVGFLNLPLTETALSLEVTLWRSEMDPA